MNYTKYENTLPFLPKPTRPPIAKNPSAKEAREYANGLEEYEKKMEEFEASRKEYHNAKAILLGQFKADALEEVGLAKHPKKDVIYGKAWEDGHSGGYSEVFNELLDLAEFVEKLEAK